MQWVMLRDSKKIRIKSEIFSDFFFCENLQKNFFYDIIYIENENRKEFV